MSTCLAWGILKFQKIKILFIGFQCFKNTAFKNPQVWYITIIAVSSTSSDTFEDYDLFPEPVEGNKGRNKTLLFFQ